MIFIELFFTFFKIGLFTVGGGYAMLPLIRTEVLSKGWLTAEEIVNFIAVSESTPGPFAVNIATYIGSVRGGAAGAVCATLGVLTVGKTVFLNSATPTGFPATASDWFRTVSSALVFVLALFACRKKLHPILMILIAAALGIAFGLLGEMLVA